MRLKFIGATESVTGSKHLIFTDKGKQILLDCGLFQGMGKETDQLNRKIDLDPANLDAVILSHGHIDHSGNLPLLVKLGYTGKIYCTTATLDVCKLLLMDSANIHESDVFYINKRRAKKGMPPIKPLYTVKDAEKCLKHFRAIPIGAEFQINDEISFNFSGTGHIIGSAAVNITATENGKKTHLTFSGDVGRYNDALLKAPDTFPQADYIICESTYGDRLHDILENSENKLMDIITHTCIDKKGKLIIPAFSLGRTQEILFAFDKLMKRNLFSDLRVYVDSPLSAGVTSVVRSHPECFNPELQEYVKSDKDPFGFSNLTYIQDSSESKALNEMNEPCIIISASGMCEAGRVKHHIKNAISDSKNTILITGYCAPETLGSKLLKGEEKVHIYGDFYDVKAEIQSILSFSAHADQLELIKFLSCQDKEKAKMIFLVHGEEDSKKVFKTKLEEQGFKSVVIPEKSEVYVL